VLTYFFSRVALFTGVSTVVIIHLASYGLPKEVHIWLVAISLVTIFVITFLNYIWFHTIVKGMLEFMQDEEAELAKPRRSSIIRVSKMNQTDIEMNKK